MAMAVGNTKDGESFPANPIQKDISTKLSERIVKTADTYLASSSPYRCVWLAGRATMEPEGALTCP